MKYKVFLKGSGIQPDDEKDDNIDKAYVTRLVNMVRAMPSKIRYKIFLLALDHWYDSDGRVNYDNTNLHVPNEYVFRVAAEYPDVFVPVPSIHPYRTDAIDELENCANRGAKLVKWLPVAMGIDPSDAKCDEFYNTMKEYDMTLLTHTGIEHSLSIKANQQLGNPLLLRRPLDKGVRVIAAHCASEGKGRDLDEADSGHVPYYELLLRLMGDSKYDDLLFADISSLTTFSHSGAPLTTFMDRTDLHHRLVHGSDYPIPALRFTVQTMWLVKQGYIKWEERAPLNEIYKSNPLLFDFVVKRVLSSPKHGNRFPASVFLQNPNLPLYQKHREAEQEQEEEEQEQEERETKEEEQAAPETSTSATTESKATPPETPPYEEHLQAETQVAV